MGQGGYFNLNNKTSHKWERVASGAYQMNAWRCPESVAAGSNVRFYYEWDQSIFHNPCDDSAYAIYQLAGTSLKFRVQAQASGGYTRYYFNTCVDLINMQLVDHAGSRVETGWVHDGDVAFTVIEYENAYYRNDPKITEYFYETHYQLLKDKPLNNISFVGSHDAGMYVLDGGTMGASAGNTLTQTLSVYNQLVRGARYFDVRPVIGNGGKLLAGHYSGMQTIASWEGRLGGNGASLETIVSDINRFAQTHTKEFIIVDLSHAYNTDSGYHDMNTAEWNRVFSVFDRTNHTLKKRTLQAFGLSTANVGQHTLDKLLQLGRVMIRVDGTCPASLPDHIFPQDSLAMVGSYSDTNNADAMISDQISKMRQHKTENNMFLLSWTLTQSGCGLIFDDIRSDAFTVNKLLTSKVMNQVTKRYYPNIIYVDNICTDVPASVANSINHYKHQLMAFDASDFEIDEMSVSTADTLTGKYISSMRLFTAASLAEARSTCPTGFVLLERAVCTNLKREMVFLCYQKTDNAAATFKSMDGSNNPDAQKKLLPIVDVDIAENGAPPIGWENFAHVRAFLPRHEHDCLIVIKRG